ncbi:hypothetical protein [Diaphorobacter aerolatus]|uniref:Uncharacterized protein n=1 Tax=Diaphorobacter aerolatus TaxID=1288495 RepID=A0A7H0GJ84_9BURK|nr:hypothetical protein [Diaphorobacter aerolatus]QNP48350.1 hypothetical protein H9K75_20745 [Diaphorobacter aerolatus]
MTKRIVAALMLCLTFILSACSGGAPNESDLKEALTNTMEAQGGKQAVDMFKDTIASTKLVGCKESKEGNGYVCDWTTDMGASSGRLVKSEKGWKIFQ